MDTVQEATLFRFEVGEEVVVRLDDVEVFEVDRSERLPAAFHPRWTIGRIVERRTADARSAYVLRFRCHGHACMSVVSEDSVEGVA